MQVNTMKVLASVGALAGGGLMVSGGIATNASAFSLGDFDELRRGIDQSEQKLHALAPNASADFSASRAEIDRTEHAHRQWLGAGLSTAVTATTALATGVAALLSRHPASMGTRMLAEASIASAASAGAAALYGLHQFNRRNELDGKLAAAMTADGAAVADAMQHAPRAVGMPTPPVPTALTGPPLPTIPETTGVVPRSTIPGAVSVEEETARLQGMDRMLGDEEKLVVRAELGGALGVQPGADVSTLDLRDAVAALDTDHDGTLTSHERSPALRAEALGFADVLHNAAVGPGGSQDSMAPQEPDNFKWLLEDIHQDFMGIPTNDIVHGLRMVANHGGPASGLQPVTWNQLAHAADKRIASIS